MFFSPIQTTDPTGHCDESSDRHRPRSCTACLAAAASDWQSARPHSGSRAGDLKAGSIRAKGPSDGLAGDLAAASFGVRRLSVRIVPEKSDIAMIGAAHGRQRREHARVRRTRALAGSVRAAMAQRDRSSGGGPSDSRVLRRPDDGADDAHAGAAGCYSRRRGDHGGRSRSACHAGLWHSASCESASPCAWSWLGEPHACPWPC